MKTFRWGMTVLLAGALFSQCWADVYVKNKLFKGQTAGKGAGTLVEPQPMLEALGITDYKIESGRLHFGESSVALEGDLVSLKALAEALGAKMVVNAELGTVDIYQASEPKVAGTTDGKAAKSSDSGSWGGGGVWLTSWSDAVAASQSSNKPILINFTGSDWCGWCIRLKSEVFQTETFKTWASDKVILFEADFPRGFKLASHLKAQNERLAQQYKVTGFPSIIFTDSSGKQMGSRFGYAQGGASAWTKQAEAHMKR